MHDESDVPEDDGVTIKTTSHLLRTMRNSDNAPTNTSIHLKDQTVDEVLDEIGIGRFHYIMLQICGAGWMVRSF
jgi:hypothetical protein